MRFKRISTDTVRCIISQEELNENGLEMDDFMSNSGRTEDFLRKMLDMAAQEVGFHIQGGPLTIQVAALPENQLALTFSEKQSGNNFSDLLEGLRAAMNSLSDAVSEKVKEKLAEQNAGSGADDTRTCLMQFENLDTLQAFCRGLEEGIEESFGMDSALYRLKDAGTYWLVIQRGSMEEKQLCRLMSASIEFLEEVSANEAQAAYIVEHGSCILKEHAITQLQNLFLH